MSDEEFEDEVGDEELEDIDEIVKKVREGVET
jgi:hypothetical protein